MERTELLRCRIALYRSYLRAGTTADQAALYLKQIKNDEAELTALADGRIDGQASSPKRGD